MGAIGVRAATVPLRGAGPRLRAVLALTFLGLAAACQDGPRLPDARLSLEETLSGADTVGYARALAPRPFLFPADHGPHPDFRNEWWYVTGNVQADDGREVGFQFTLFRSSLAPEPREGASAWGTNQAYMAHLAVTDARGGRFHAFERFARGAAGLAGARAEPFRVWLEDWSLEGERRGPAPGPSGSVGRDPAGGNRGDLGRSATDVFPLRLRAGEGAVSLDLTLSEGKPMVLQGNAGLSQKGPEAGNASYYYAFTRMPTAGTVVLGGDTLTVTGSAWLDREWSTSALSEGQVGWDWFALQLDHGWELMVYALRMEDGSAHPLSDGVLVGPDGGKTDLVWGRDFTVTPTGTWRSPVDGSAYPSGWRIEIPGREMELEVTPTLPGQELDLAFRYWEGSVRVTGRDGDRPVAGRGYVELTGYAGRRPER